MSFLQDWHKQQKAIRDAERDRKKNASSLLHSYRGGEHDVKDHGGSKKNVSARTQNDRATGHDISEHGEVFFEQNMQNDVYEDAGPYISTISEGGKCRTKDYIPVKSRQLLTVDFSFGVIYDESEDPAMESFDLAASVIIPHAISQWRNETKIFCDPKTPEVIGDICSDDWYDGEDSVRYIVKGKVPVNVFVDSSADDVAKGLQKVLKRHVSFRPISSTEADEATKEQRAQFIIGDGVQQWMRVREGRLGGLGITF